MKGLTAQVASLKKEKRDAWDTLKKERMVAARAQIAPPETSTKSTEPDEAEKSPTSYPLEFDVVSSRNCGYEMVDVNVKITNISDRHVNSCYATCILQDAQGKNLTFQGHYVIKSDDGLATGASTYFEYVIDVRQELVKGVSFHIETLDW